MEVSTVCSVTVERGFGFIRGVGGHGDYFFHANDVIAPLEFDAQLNERRVTFTVVETERGLRAKCVQAAE